LESPDAAIRLRSESDGSAEDLNEMFCAVARGGLHFGDARVVRRVSCRVEEAIAKLAGSHGAPGIFDAEVLVGEFAGGGAEERGCATWFKVAAPPGLK
jgi:hypothetical protein